MAHPKVVVRPVPFSTRHVAWCYEEIDGEPCEFVYTNLAKGDVEQQASWHRREHREGKVRKP